MKGTKWRQITKEFRNKININGNWKMLIRTAQKSTCKETKGKGDRENEGKITFDWKLMQERQTERTKTGSEAEEWELYNITPSYNSFDLHHMYWNTRQTPLQLHTKAEVEGQKVE